MNTTKRRHVCYRCGERAPLAIGTLICMPCVDAVTDAVIAGDITGSVATDVFGVPALQEGQR